MARIEWDEQQQRTANYNSSVIPDTTEEFEGSRFGALARTMNTGVAADHRLSFNQNSYNTSAYEGVQFTRSNIRAQLTEQGEDPQIIDEIMTSRVNNWEEVERRRDYLTEYYRDQRQISEEFSTVGALGYGLPMAVLDPTTLLLGPVAGGVGKGMQVANLATRLGRMAPTVQFAAAGGLEALADNIIYEQVTGVYEDNSNINAALIGMALGGTLGTFIGRSTQQPLTSFSDDAGRAIASAEVRDTRLANAMTTREEMEALSEAVDAIRREAEAPTPTPARDGEAPVEQRPSYAGIENARRNIDDIRAVRQENTTRTRQATTAIRREEEAIAKGEADLSNVRRMAAEVEGVSATITRTSDALEVRKQFPDGLPSKTRFINERVDAHRASGDNSRTIKAVREEAGSEYARLRGATDEFADTSTSVLRARLAKAERKVASLNKKVAKVAPDGNTAKVISDMERMLTASRNKALMRKTEKDNIAKENKRLKKSMTRAQRVLDNEMATLGAREVQVGGRSVTLKELADKHKVDLTPEGVQKLSNRYGAVKRDIDKMLNDDYSELSDAYGVKGEVQNPVAKLEREMSEIDNHLDDVTKSEGWQRVNPFLRKLLISPIEKLLNSDNALVSGFARKLHAGTVNHGVSNTRNAYNVKRNLDAQQNRLNRQLRNDYHKATQDGSFNGSLDEWHDLVGRETFTTTGATQRAAYADYDGALSWQERLELAKERTAGLQREYGTENVHIRSSIDATLDYFEMIHTRGNKLGMDAFRESLGKGYVKRIYSKRAIETLGRDTAIQRLVDAQEKFAVATNKPWGPEDIADARAMAIGVVNRALDPAATVKAIMQPLGVTREGKTSAFKQRTIEAFDDDLADLLETNVEGITNLYGMNVHGRLALHGTIGVSDDAGIEALLGTLKATPKELNNLRVVIDTVKGVRELDKNPTAAISRATKALSSYSSVMHSMAFGVTSLTEFAAIAGEYGLGRTLQNLVGRPQDVYQMYRTGKVADKNQIDLLVIYGDAHFNTRANRYDADTGFDSVGRGQAFLDKMQHYTSVYGGLVPVTDALRMSTATMTVDFLARLSVSSKISSADIKRLGDAGFSEADLPRIREALDVSPDGRINNKDRATWGDINEDIDLAVQTMVDRVILDPNGATLPAFMTNYEGGAFVPRIFAKFLRFPIESIERMMYRGVQEMDARRAIGFAANFATWAAVLAAKDAIRGEERGMYEDGDYATLFKDALMYSSVVGGVGAIADVVAGITTGKNLTNDFSYRFGGVVVSDINKMQNFTRGLLTGDADRISRGPTFHVPMATVRIGEGVAAAMTTLRLIEETNR